MGSLAIRGWIGVIGFYRYKASCAKKAEDFVDIRFGKDIACATLIQGLF